MPLNKGNSSDLTEVVTPEPRQEWAEVAGEEGAHKWRGQAEAVTRIPFQRGPQHVYRQPLSLILNLLQRQGLCAVGGRWAGRG